MNHDSFKQLEALFHELSELPEIDRLDRLMELDQSDSNKAIKLRAMFASITTDPDFLDTESIEARVSVPIEIALDGSTILANRYTIVECIGVGGSSTVFRAKATNPDRDVAIKMLRFGLSSQRARDRFDKESKALASLTHPHIAHVYETGIHQCDGIEVPWIAMELVDGSQTIMDHVREKQLSESKCIELFAQVCGAIQAAHDRGLLHLDLNASNILIDSHGYPKIIDFGLAGLIYSTKTTKPSFVGTRTSMAPEQTLFGSVPFDERTDIYALGLLFVEILTGHQLQAFFGQSDKQSRQLIAMGKARELFHQLDIFPTQHHNLVDTMLRVDPNDRSSAVLQIIDQLQNTEQVDPTRRPTRILAAVVLLGIIAGTVYFTQSPSNTPPLPIQDSQSPPNTFVLPAEVAMDISSENPRSTKFSSSHERIIAGISSAIESSNQMDPEQAASLHATLADNYRIAGMYNQAIKQYQQAISLLNKPGLVTDRNWILLSLADLLLFLGHTDQAQEHLVRIDRSATADPLFLLDLGVAESQVHIRLGELNAAFRQIEYTYSLLDSVPSENNQERVERMITLSELLISIEESPAALEILLKARAFAKKSFSPASTTEAFVNIAIANATFSTQLPNAFDDARDSIWAAIKSFESADDKYHAAWASRQLGNMYLSSGDTRQAFEIYNEAFTQMSSLLGQDHHETIVCQAYREVTLIALGNNTDLHTKLFTESINALVVLLGNEHEIIKSLREAHRRIASHSNTTHP